MIGLGLRIATRGRGAWGRQAAIAGGVAVGVALLLTGFAIPGARDRYRATEATLSSPVPAPDETVPHVRWNQQFSAFGAATSRRYLVGVVGQAPPAPAWLGAWPAPGERVVSPATRRRYAEAGAALPPGTRLLGREILPHPGAEIDIVGVDPANLEGSPAITGFRDDARPAEVSPAERRNWAAVLGVGAAALLVPILAFLAAVGRLGVRRREERFAALRLVGAGRAQAARLAAVEGLPAAILGVLGGMAAFQLAVRPLAERWSIFGVGVWADDLSPRPWQWIAVGLLVPLLASAATAVGVSRALHAPLGVRRRAADRRPGAWRLAIAPLGLAAVWATGEIATEARVPQAVVTLSTGLAFGLLALGVVAAGPWVIARLGQSLGGRASGVSGLLGGRRLESAPRAGFRAITGVALALVAATSFATLATSAFEQSRRVFDTAPNGATSPDGFSGPVVVVQAPTRAGFEEALVARLGAVQGVASVSTLRRVVLPDGGEAVAIDCGGLTPVIGGRSCEELVSRPTDAQRAILGALGAARGRLVDASTLPPAAARPILGMALPFDGAAATYQRVQGHLALAAPTAFAAAYGPGAHLGDGFNGDLGRARGVGEIVLLVVLLIAGASLALLAVESVLERRRTLAALAALGTSTRTLRRAVGIEIWLPLLVTGLAAAVLGIAGGATMAARSDLPVVVPWGLIGRLVLEAGLAGLVVTLVVLPALRRVLQPTGLRAE